MAESGIDDAADRPLRRWQVGAAILFIAVQALVPPAIVMAAEHLPTVFAWQMFSRGTPLVRFEVTYDDGRVILYAPRNVVIKDRSDIPFAVLVPPLLCREPAARRVRIETPEGERVVQCP